jgi:hypothetical protein
MHRARKVRVREKGAVERAVGRHEAHRDIMRPDRCKVASSLHSDKALGGANC